MILRRLPPLIKTIQPVSGVKLLAQPLTFLTFLDDRVGILKFDHWSRKFAEKGYQSLFIQMDPHIAANSSSSSWRLETIEHQLSVLEQELVSILQNPSSTLNSSPFPPLLFSHAYSTLLAETYVSSHPLSGLILHSPSLVKMMSSREEKNSFSNSSSSAFASASKVDTSSTLFNYEPGFPIALIESGERMKDGERSVDGLHRLVREFGEEGEENVTAWNEGLIEKEEKKWEKVMDWMDENRL